MSAIIASGDLGGICVDFQVKPICYHHVGEQRR